MGVLPRQQTEQEQTDQDSPPRRGSVRRNGLAKHDGQFGRADNGGESVCQRRSGTFRGHCQGMRPESRDLARREEKTAGYVRENPHSARVLKTKYPVPIISTRWGRVLTARLLPLPCGIPENLMAVADRCQAPLITAVL
ncbi:hypothetical protein D9X30_2356 [Cupriavidus sp. U2]|nr:hypothetical protein D9X30_2356 [Cupriavidus sp. U2]